MTKNTISTYHIALLILARVVTFAIGGAFAGYFIGALEGGGFGGVLGSLFQGNFGNSISERVRMGITVGTSQGRTVGMAAAAVAFAIVGLLQPAHADLQRSFRGAMCGAIIFTLFGAAAGAISGTGLHLLFRPAGTPFNLFGGFHLGCIGGFTIGLFAGALLGGTGRLRHVSWRSAMRWALPARPAGG